MIPQRNTIKIYIQNMQHLKVKRELEFGNFKFYEEGGGEGGTGKVREEENKQKIFWRFTLFGGIP